MSLDRLFLAKGPSIKYDTAGVCMWVGCPGKRYGALHEGGVDYCRNPIGKVCLVV